MTNAKKNNFFFYGKKLQRIRKNHYFIRKDQEIGHYQEVVKLGGGIYI